MMRLFAAGLLFTAWFMKKPEYPFGVQRAGGGLGPDVLVCLPLLERNVPHGFTHRWRFLERGQRRQPYGSRGREHTDREDLAHAVDLAGAAHMKQVHGTRIRVVSKPSLSPPVCDGILTRQKDLGLVVRTADCVPLLMWESRRNVVGAVHAGWRGTLAGIASRAVGYFEKENASQPDCIHVAMGPAIGRCCYEVGDEVKRAFLEAFPDVSGLFSRGERGRSHLDLAEENRRQLVEAGVPPDQIYSADVCTSCENDILYSYRREGEGVGRLFGIIGVATR